MKYIHELIVVSLLFCFSAKADIVAPFEVDFSRLKKNNLLKLYADTRVIYGEGVESNVVGRLRNRSEQIKLGVRYKRFFENDLFFKADVRGVYIDSLNKDDVDRDKVSDVYLEVRELFLEKQNIFSDLPIALLVGRKQFRDERSWWYSNQLDVVQLRYSTTLLNADVSYGSRLVDERVITESENIGFEDSEFFIAHLDYHYYYKHHFQAFMIYQNDDFSNNRLGKTQSINSTLKPELNLLWLGGRLNGMLSLENKDKLKYWLDVAVVNGSEREFVTTATSLTQKTISAIRDINVSTGYGFDFGAAWKTADDKWGLAANYAFGSGDNSASDQQSSYRQPALAINKGSVFGENRYRIYGELLRPELSNLQLFSLSAGRRINPRLWLQAVYFNYKQVQADRELRASNLIISPNGNSKNIGNEIDLILVGSWTKNISTEFVLSQFRAGSAFNGLVESGNAYKGVVQLRVNW